MESSTACRLSGFCSSFMCVSGYSWTRHQVTLFPQSWVPRLQSAAPADAPAREPRLKADTKGQPRLYAFDGAFMVPERRLQFRKKAFPRKGVRLHCVCSLEKISE